MAKLAKAAVHYRAANWWERYVEARTCGDCSMYRDGICTLVLGAIKPSDVCDRWERKK